MTSRGVRALDAGARAEPVADDDFLIEEGELNTNTKLTRAIERLTREIHQAVAVTDPPGQP